MSFLRSVSSKVSLCLRKPPSATCRSLSTNRINCASLTQLSKDEMEIKERVNKFCLEVVSPRVKEMDRTEKMDQVIIDSLFANGLMGLDTDPKYGGHGSTFFNVILAIEELAKFDPSVSILMDVQSTLIINVLVNYASEELKLKYLPRLCKDTVGSFCLSEPGSGSDSFALKTRADKSGDSYIINGGKSWITNAEHASVFLVFANVDPSKGYKGITCFVVDANQSGVTVAKPEKKLGIRASSTCGITFEDVKVPTSNIIGEIGHGYKYAIGCLNEGRIGIGAQMIGLAQGCFDATMKYSLQKNELGERLFDSQGFQFELSKAAIQIESSRLLVYNAARLRESGAKIIKEGAMAKYTASEMATDITAKCLKLVGPEALKRFEDGSLPIEKFCRDSMIGVIYEGTSNIQLNTIAKLLESEYQRNI